jgi:predicted nucleic acid-binding protein
MTSVILDSGPLIAYFDRRDQDHERVHRWFASSGERHRLLCTEAVVTEVTHLLDFDVPLQTTFLLWAAQATTIHPIPVSAYPDIAQWMLGYANVPMDFADATVLWLYSTTSGSQILTLDQRGFGVFRLPGQSRKAPKVIALV